jgi:hypothetical protein
VAQPGDQPGLIERMGFYVSYLHRHLFIDSSRCCRLKISNYRLTSCRERRYP